MDVNQDIKPQDPKPKSLTLTLHQPPLHLHSYHSPTTCTPASPDTAQPTQKHHHTHKFAHTERKRERVCATQATAMKLATLAAVAKLLWLSDSRRGQKELIANLVTAVTETCDFGTIQTSPSLSLLLLFLWW